jgi:hypothetical protein
MARKSIYPKRINRFFLFLIVLSFNSSLFAQLDLTRPTVTSVSPGNLSLSFDAGLYVTATFSEAMNASTITAANFELRNTLTNALVPAVITYNATTRTAKLSPLSLLNSIIYSVKVRGGTTGVKDVAGNAMVSDYNWNFLLLPIFDFTDPSVLSTTPANNATGVSTTTTVSAQFSEEMTASTINTATFELRNPANTLVPATVSYNAAARTAVLTPSGALAGNTKYTATIKSGSAGVRDARGNSIASNYVWSFTTLVPVPVDVTAPTVALLAPASGATGVAVNTTVTALFSEAMNAATISTSTVELRNAANTLITAGVSYNASTRVVTLTPTASLANGTTYTATIKGGTAGVKDVANNALVNNYSWSFTTFVNTISIFDPNVLPEVPLAGGDPLEVGFRFRTSQNGYITGLRFYKGLGNDGTHIGHLWTNTGTKLTEATFSQETASGWQQVLFTTPVAVTAGNTYVASYFSTAGLYAYTNNYFTHAYENGPLRALADGEDGGNGVYTYAPTSTFPTNTFLSSNYFVDVLFATAGTGPDVWAPFVQSFSPANNATTVAANSALTVVFNEPVNAATVNSSTIELRNSGGTLVPASVTYTAANNTAKLTPLSSLAYSTVYTAKVKGGTAGVKDVAANSMVSDYNSVFTTVSEPLPDPNQGPGGPILIVSSTANPFSRYSVEILRAEGLNHFTATDVSTLTATLLNGYDVVVLGEMPVTADQVALLTTWVNNGGTLIAFKPSALLAPLMGITPITGILNDKYLLVNTAAGPGYGIVNQTIQYHSGANLYALSGATSLATIYSNATTATTYPAITTRNVGANGGVAVAFAYDLAKSIVYTRQGNPAWAGQKRDGQIDPIRSDDLFFPDYVDFNKVAIPQADEQQRLLANIILQDNLHRKPLPRFWYLPRDLKAAIVMTGDDHAVNGTAGRFDQYLTLGPNTPQDVADWKAIRGTSYIYPNTTITNAQAAAYEAQGFEIALHPTTNCTDYTLSSLQTTYSTQLAQFNTNFPNVSAPSTNRTHCLVWSDWASSPKVEVQNGIRLNTTYYYWPAEWVQNRPGVFTGSGMPMRFADMDGTLIDNYQLVTQLTDESGIGVGSFTNALLDKALGSEGYYGVFCANMHTDTAIHTGSNAIIAAAQARQVPVISAKQMLTWLNGRNSSSFTNLIWNNNKLNFTINTRSGANSLKAMLPLYSATGQLISITMNGSPVAFTLQTIKGIQYAFFPAAMGSNAYVADYSASVLRTASQPVTATAATADKAPAQTAETVWANLEVRVMPNPSNGYFNLVVNSNDDSPVTVRILDVFGQSVEKHEKVATGNLRIGQTLAAGTYFAEITQGGQRKLVKLVKVN